jgi:hypothetical protein
LGPLGAFFDQHGYTALRPGWPDDPETVGQANANREVFAHKTVGQAADRYSGIVRGLGDTSRADDGAVVVLHRS